MIQVFAATFRHGSITSPINRGSYHEALLHAAAHPDRNEKMLRFLLGEMLYCEFHPDNLDDNLFGEFKGCLKNDFPIKPELIEVKSILRCGFHSPTINAYALFELEVEREFTCSDWTIDHSTHPSVHNALKMCWTFPWANNPVDEYYERHIDVDAVFPLVVDEANFMPITC